MCHCHCHCQCEIRLANALSQMTCSHHSIECVSIQTLHPCTTRVQYFTYLLLLQQPGRSDNDLLARVGLSLRFPISFFAKPPHGTSVCAVTVAMAIHGRSAVHRSKPKPRLHSKPRVLTSILCLLRTQPLDEPTLTVAIDRALSDNRLGHHTKLMTSLNAHFCNWRTPLLPQQKTKVKKTI